MNASERAAELLAFFKALADANRLKIVGLLAEEDFSVGHLAAILDLRPSTVSHHLGRLAGVGLVTPRREGHENLYKLETDALEAMARRLLAEETFSEVAAAVDLGAYDRKVVRDYLTSDGRLKTIPAQRKKLEAVLRHVARAFEPGRRYSERQVNDVLERFHEDTATLRRELIVNKLMARAPDGSAYWLREN